MKHRMLETKDHLKLYLQVDSVENPKAVVIVVHGLCEHCGRYDYVTERLNDAGYSVYRFDHRGHGRSEGKKVYYDSWDENSNDVFDVVQTAKTENPGKKIYVLGHSMGGYATACFATRFPSEADGIILSGALTRYNTQCAGPLPIEAPMGMYVPNALGEGVCSDPAVTKAYNEDPLVAKEMSIGLLNSMYIGVGYLKEHAQNFIAPVLILHGCNDGIVSPKDSMELFQEIRSTDKSLRIYAHLLHEIFNEPVKSQIMDDVVLWLNTRV